MTHNGKVIETEYFDEVRGRLFPLLGLTDRVELVTNFGNEPFRWTSTQAVTTNGVEGLRKEEQALLAEMNALKLE